MTFLMILTMGILSACFCAQFVTWEGLKQFPAIGMFIASVVLSIVGIIRFINVKFT